MGLFDILAATAPCPRCGHCQEWYLQYKYGNSGQNRYQLGDQIPWSEDGRHNHGRRVGGLVRVVGMAEQLCSRCGCDAGASIFLEGDRLARAELEAEPIGDILGEGFECLGGQTPETPPVPARRVGKLTRCGHCEWATVDAGEGRCPVCGRRLLIEPTGPT